MKYPDQIANRVMITVMAAAIMVIVGWLWWQYESCRGPVDRALDIPVQVDRYDETRNMIITQQRLLREQTEQMAALKAELDRLQIPASQITTIIHSSGTVPGSQTTETVQESNFHREIKAANGMAVAWVDRHDNQYMFGAYDLTYTGGIYVGKGKTRSSMSVTSSGSPGVSYPVHAEYHVWQNIDYKLFEPNLAVGITGVLPIPEARGSLAIEFIHPGRNWDLAGIRLSAGRQVGIGLDVVGWNIGSKAPILTNTWIWAGLGTSTDLQPELQLTLGTKL